MSKDPETDYNQRRSGNRTIFLEDLMRMIARIHELEHIKKYNNSLGVEFTEDGEIELNRLKSFEIKIPERQEIP